MNMYIIKYMTIAKFKNNMFIFKENKRYFQRNLFGD